jgi:asparagine synthase (glutamine-hydrolysing)
MGDDASPMSLIPDGDLILHAYLRWGENAPWHILGDWAFAAFHPAERKLFLARDHFGNTSLYYYSDPRVFAFSSDRAALLALNLTPPVMDELYLAQVLITWDAYHGERTIDQRIKRLPPAHYLTITAEQLEVRQYWRLEDTPYLSLRRREEYVEAFSEVLNEAVRVRLRAPNERRELQQEKRGDDDCGKVEASPIGVTLSGGLDSSSVTATAFRFLQAEGKGLTAFTSVPLSDTEKYVRNNFGDEFPFAQATAQFAGNVDHVPITGASLTPIDAIRRMLQIDPEPAHAAGNYYWLLELQAAAAMRGCRVLLTGQMGNASISWAGEIHSQPLAVQLRQLGWRKWASDEVRLTKRLVKPHVLKGLRAARLTPHSDLRQWCRHSAIHPDFARRLDLLEMRRQDLEQAQVGTPRDARCSIIKPGRSLAGALWASMGAAHGLEVRDPTADVRVLEFTLSVPDHIFIDPETGMDRWLIREAMKDRLPETVRLNRKKGRQAGDLVPRLRASAMQVESALDELERGPAARYVDVPYMREAWQLIQTQDTPEAYHKSVTVLTRGIMGGLFVNQCYSKG